MGQSGSRTYSSIREIIRIGNSVGVTIDQVGLRESGIDPDELTEKRVYTKIDGDRVIIELSDPE